MQDNKTRLLLLIYVNGNLPLLDEMGTALGKQPQFIDLILKEGKKQLLLF